MISKRAAHAVVAIDGIFGAWRERPVGFVGHSACIEQTEQAACYAYRRRGKTVKGDRSGMKVANRQIAGLVDEN